MIVTDDVPSSSHITSAEALVVALFGDENLSKNLQKSEMDLHVRY